MATQTTQQKELRDFMLIVRAALIMVVRYIERKYMSSESQTPVVSFGDSTSTKK